MRRCCSRSTPTRFGSSSLRTPCSPRWRCSDEHSGSSSRPDAVARRRENARRTARENLEELIDEGTFVEYGPLLFAAQESRRDRAELIRRTPADGLVAGIGEIEGRRCVAMSYDYTVLAGT